MNATDNASLRALQDVATDGVAAVSTRRLAELIGRTRSTAAASLQRHIAQGRVERISGGSGVRMGRYRIIGTRVENRCQIRTTMDPAKPASSVVPDLFRSPDLYGAGQLHSVAPKESP